MIQHYTKFIANLNLKIRDPLNLVAEVHHRRDGEEAGAALDGVVAAHPGQAGVGGRLLLIRDRAEGRAEGTGVPALATGNAPVLEAAKTALSIAARVQDLQLLDWRRRQVGWLVRAECGGVKSSPPLPEIPLSRPPPDPLGERPLSWRGPPLRLFSIRAARGRRSSASFVFRPQETPESAWTASWRQP